MRATMRPADPRAFVLLSVLSFTLLIGVLLALGQALQTVEQETIRTYLSVWKRDRALVNALLQYTTAVGSSQPMPSGGLSITYEGMTALNCLFAWQFTPRPEWGVLLVSIPKKHLDPICQLSDDLRTKPAHWAHRGAKLAGWKNS